MEDNKAFSGIVVKIDPASIHELLTPLNQILGYSELLVEEVENSGQVTLLGDLYKIKQAAHDLAGRFNDLFSGAAQPPSASLPEQNHLLQSALTKIRQEHPDGSTAGNVLVVDDNEVNREILSRRLELQGHRVVMAEDGYRALEQLRKESFDLVLLDIMMPGMDGYEVLREIKSNQKLRHIPVVIISANTDMDSVIQCIERGAEDYLSKPFNPTLLKARIGAILEKKRLREQEQRLIEQAMRVEAALERHRALIQAVAGIAHEINTPLGIACTGISIIENRFALPETQAHFKGNKENAEQFQDILDSTGLIKKNIIRAHQLVENFKKIAVNQMVEHKETVNLPYVLADAIDLFKMSAKQAKLSIELDVSGIKGSRDWLGYPGYLTQILMNFFQNIERYAYPDGCGGKVEIIAADILSLERGDLFILTVRDYGVGISPDHIGKIFDPFFTTGRGKGGTGLGLSIVNNIVTLALKGAIEVISAPETGTCFTVQFPKTIND